MDTMILMYVIMILLLHPEHSGADELSDINIQTKTCPGHLPENGDYHPISSSVYENGNGCKIMKMKSTKSCGTDSCDEYCKNKECWETFCQGKPTKRRTKRPKAIFMNCTEGPWTCQDMEFVTLEHKDCKRFGAKLLSTKNFTITRVDADVTQTIRAAPEHFATLSHSTSPEPLSTKMSTISTAEKYHLSSDGNERRKETKNNWQVPVGATFGIVFVMVVVGGCVIYKKKGKHTCGSTELESGYKLRYDEIPREDDEHSQFKPQNRSNNEIRNTSHNTEPFLPDVNSKAEVPENCPSNESKTQTYSAVAIHGDNTNIEKEGVISGINIIGATNCNFNGLSGIQPTPRNETKSNSQKEPSSIHNDSIHPGKIENELNEISPDKTEKWDVKCQVSNERVTCKKAETKKSDSNKANNSVDDVLLKRTTEKPFSGLRIIEDWKKLTNLISPGNLITYGNVPYETLASYLDVLTEYNNGPAKKESPDTQLHDLLNIWKRKQEDQDILVSSFISHLEKGQREKGGDQVNLLICAIKKSLTTDMPVFDVDKSFEDSESSNDVFHETNAEKIIRRRSGSMDSALNDLTELGGRLEVHRKIPFPYTQNITFKERKRSRTMSHSA